MNFCQRWDLKSVEIRRAILSHENLWSSLSFYFSFTDRWHFFVNFLVFSLFRFVSSSVLGNFREAEKAALISVVSDSVCLTFSPSTKTASGEKTEQTIAVLSPNPQSKGNGERSGGKKNLSSVSFHSSFLLLCLSVMGWKRDSETDKTWQK